VKNQSLGAAASLPAYQVALYEVLFPVAEGSQTTGASGSPDTFRIFPVVTLLTILQSTSGDLPRAAIALTRKKYSPPVLAVHSSDVPLGISPKASVVTPLFTIFV
jgi:hypothetical protein